MNDEIRAATVRIKNGLEALVASEKRGNYMLPDLASMALEAEQVYSAISFLYNSMYALSMAHGTIGVRPVYPIAKKPRTGRH
jgi:hypothetical protein